MRVIGLIILGQNEAKFGSDRGSSMRDRRLLVLNISIALMLSDFFGIL